jgi:hypothetical protein
MGGQYPGLQEGGQDPGQQLGGTDQCANNWGDQIITPFYTKYLKPENSLDCKNNCPVIIIIKIPLRAIQLISSYDEFRSFKCLVWLVQHYPILEIFVA